MTTVSYSKFTNSFVVQCVSLVTRTPLSLPFVCIHIIFGNMYYCEFNKMGRCGKRGYSVYPVFSRLAQYKHPVKGNHLYVLC